MNTDVFARRAQQADRDEVVAILSSAFAKDPLWSGAMARDGGGTAHHQAFWRVFVDGAMRYPWTWLTEQGEATSLWIPPGGTDMSPEQEARLEAVARQELGPRSDLYIELVKRFADAHPHGEPHYYLTLLGTHSDHRGHGIGMALLRHDLAIIDAEHVPAYLESSNPANDHRYAAAGFEPFGKIVPPTDAAVVTTMWRPAR